MKEQDYFQQHLRHLETTRVITERARREWGNNLIDAGDSHVKGEVSLCVGEAA